MAWKMLLKLGTGGHDMKGLNEVDSLEKKNSEKLRGNVYPDSEEKLDDDLIAKPETQKDDGLIVDSDHPENEEWNAREKVKRDEDLRH